MGIYIFIELAGFETAGVDYAIELVSSPITWLGYLFNVQNMLFKLRFCGPFFSGIDENHFNMGASRSL